MNFQDRLKPVVMTMIISLLIVFCVDKCNKIGEPPESIVLIHRESSDTGYKTATKVILAHKSVYIPETGYTVRFFSIFAEVRDASGKLLARISKLIDVDAGTADPEDIEIFLGKGLGKIIIRVQPAEGLTWYEDEIKIEVIESD